MRIMAKNELHIQPTTVCSRKEGKFHPAIRCSLFIVQYFPDEIFNSEDAAYEAAKNYVNEALEAANAVMASWKTSEF